MEKSTLRLLGLAEVIASTSGQAIITPFVHVIEPGKSLGIADGHTTGFIYVGNMTAPAYTNVKMVPAFPSEDVKPWEGGGSGYAAPAAFDTYSEYVFSAATNGDGAPVQFIGYRVFLPETQRLVVEPSTGGGGGGGLGSGDEH